MMKPCTLSVLKLVTVQPLPLNSGEEPTPGHSQEGNTKSPLLGEDLGVGELLLKLKGDSGFPLFILFSDLSSIPHSVCLVQLTS